ncbi:MAG: hypothetical protein U0350_45385 [Caldilineaceae bacterium]
MELQTELSEKEFDKIVIDQAEDDTAWDEPIIVQRKNVVSFAIPAELAVRAAFLARLHHKTSVEEWLTNIIVERIAFEEAAFAGVKEALATK